MVENLRLGCTMLCVVSGWHRYSRKNFNGKTFTVSKKRKSFPPQMIWCIWYILCMWYRRVKTLAVKKFGEKAAAKDWQKKLGRMLTCITNHQSSINSKMEPNESILSIENIIKQTLYFSVCHVLVACHSMMARHTVESMICGYHEYISKLLLESELDILKYSSIDILTSILTQNKLKHTSRCCVHLMLQKIRNWQKQLANCCDSPNLPKFFPFQSFLLYGIWCWFQFESWWIFDGSPNSNNIIIRIINICTAHTYDIALFKWKEKPPSHKSSKYKSLVKKQYLEKLPSLWKITELQVKLISDFTLDIFA